MSKIKEIFKSENKNEEDRQTTEKFEEIKVSSTVFVDRY